MGAAAAAAAAAALLSTGGQMFANDQNRKEAERNRRFQEHMSSTAVQRSVKDYQAAGLNPGLAYDRTASSPGGAQAMIGDPITPGINSAQRTRELTQQIEESRARILQTQATGAQASTQAALNKKQTELAEQERLYREAWQPVDLNIRGVELLLRKALLPGAINTANFETTTGQLGKGVNITREIVKLLQDARNK